MADSTISALTAAAVLDGTEALPIAQATSTVRTTTQAVANLASATSAKINTASAAATSVDTRVNALSQVVSVLSNVVSNEISARAASIQTLSAAVTSVDTRVNTLSNTLSAVSALSVGVAANGLQSAINALSNTISSVSAAVTSVDTRVNTVSNLVSQHTVSLAAVSNFTSLVNAVSAVSGAGTAVGLQSVVNALSNRISAITGGGTTSDQVSAMIASVASTSYSSRTSIGGATSTKGIQSAINNLSLQISSLNSVVSNALSAGDVISANVASIASAISLVSTVSAGGVAVGLQSCINAISNRLSILSNSISAVSTVSTTGTAVGLQSVVDALSNRLSYFVTPPNAITTNAPITRRVLSAPSTVVASAALADISGLSVSVKNGGIYQFFSYLMLTRGGAATVHGFGITFPAMTACRGSMETHVSVSQSVLVANNCYETYFDQTGSGSILISVSASQGARLPTFLKAEGLLVPSANGVVQMQAKAAGGTSALSVLTGSYIEVRRIN